MNDPEFESLECDQATFSDNYESGFNQLSLKVLLLHTLSYLFKVKQHINQNQLVEGHAPLKESQLKNIQYEDSCIYIAQSLHNKLKERQEREGVKVSGKGLLKIMIWHLKGIITYSIVLYFLELAFKLWFSGNLMNLFLAISKGESGQAYGYAAAACGIWFFGQVFRHNAYYSIPIISCRIRAGVILLLFSKVSRLTSFSAKASQLGKITNLLSSDFNAIQNKLPFVLAGLMLPFGLVGATVLIWIMVGWPAVFTFIVPLLIFPVVLKISKKIKEFIVLISVSKDSRIKLCTELIQGIRFIKLYGWEMAFKRKIQSLRESEISNFMSLAVGRTFEKAVSNSVAYFSGFFIFLAASLIGTLQINDIFSSLEVLTYLRFQLFYFVSGISLYYEIEVTFDRIANILNQPEIQMLKWADFSQAKEPLELIINPGPAQEKKMKGIQETAQDMVAQSLREFSPEKWTPRQLIDVELEVGQVKLLNFSGWWSVEPSSEPQLKDITLHSRPLQFLGIMGEVGSGKSGLLLALTGEIPYFTGHISLNGRVAYVEQEPVILSGTVRENILFLAHFRPQLYEQVVDSANLGADFDQFPNSDNTIVGQKGITLSGGQKARIALARALYAEADIYLLDDPLSAVDVKVAKELLEQCILPLTKRATVLLATHQIQFLYSCDSILVMQKGRVVQSGDPRSILPIAEDIKASGRHQEPHYSAEQPTTPIEEQRQRERAQGRMAESSVEVSFQSYQSYLFMSKVNKCLLPVTIVLFLVSEGINMFYLRALAQHQNMVGGTYFISSLSSYWLLLGLLQLGYFVLQVLRYACLNMVILLSNQELHERMIHGVVRSHSRFFDLTPPGQLINAFSNDLGMLDMALPFSFTDMVEGPIISVVMLVNVFTIQLPFIPLGIANLLFLVLFFLYAKQPIVECRQLYLKQRTPVFGQFAEMLTSLSQIRVFGKRLPKLREFAATADLSSKTNMSFQVISRGFGVYVSYASSLFMFAAFFMGVHLTAPSEAGNYGVTIVLLTSVSDYLQYFLKQIITVQSIMLSSERARKIVNLPPQAPFRTDYDRGLGLQEEVKAEAQGKDVMTDWPKEASVILSNFSLRYREELPLVLKDIDLRIKKGQRVGIVGRTGAGKSSIIQAIFRLTEPEPNSEYFIGENDALKMGLHSLRKHISVIPQTPFLFRGTIRENLDPFREKADQDIWKALEEAGLSVLIKSMPESLETDISAGAEVFSVGQKQLICLARALLRKNHLLVLDEATSNVDMSTDQRIQAVIRQKFVGTTVLTVAHRLTTIADYDKVVVMAEGRIIEAGQPWELIQKGGYFSEMVSRSSNNSRQITLKAKNTFARTT